MLKAKSYLYSRIEEYANDNGYYVTFHGNYLVGEQFVVLKHYKIDITISFVLTGTTGNGNVYECIYSDIDEENTLND